MNQGIEAGRSANAKVSDLEDRARQSGSENIFPAIISKSK
jgi:hypothetical protein